MWEPVGVVIHKHHFLKTSAEIKKPPVPALTRKTFGPCFSPAANQMQQMGKLVRNTSRTPEKGDRNVRWVINEEEAAAHVRQVAVWPTWSPERGRGTLWWISCLTATLVAEDIRGQRGFTCTFTLSCTKGERQTKIRPNEGKRQTGIKLNACK